MKKSIERHEKCLARIEVLVDAKCQEAESVKRQRDKHILRYVTYRDQIKEAKRRGMDGFDAERLLKKRGKK